MLRARQSLQHALMQFGGGERCVRRTRRGAARICQADAVSGKIIDESLLSERASRVVIRTSAVGIVREERDRGLLRLRHADRFQPRNRVEDPMLRATQ